MKSNKSLLKLLDIPAFDNAMGMCEIMHLDFERVNFLAESSRRFYRRATIPKKSGGDRVIYAPVAELKAIQAWILRNILDKLKPSLFATAFVHGVGLSSNVEPHQYNRYFLCLDLEDFFPSINRWRVLAMFKCIGYSEPACKFLSALCTTDNVLPQGAVTSPALSNLIAARLDRRLAGFTSRRAVAYSRYADDLTFSCNDPCKLRDCVCLIVQIIEEEGFVVNKSKTRFLGPSNRCCVTGLSKNVSQPRFSIGRNRYRMIRAEMHALSQGKVPLRYKTIESVLGVVSFVGSVSPSHAKSLRQYGVKLKLWSNA